MSSVHHHRLSFTYAVKHEILTLFFLVLALPEIPHAGAQSSPNNDDHRHHHDDDDDGYPYTNQFTPSIAIIVVVLIAALFFMGFISIYIRRCNSGLNGENNVIAVGGGAGRSRRPRGLDRAVIDSFPTFVYSSVKGIKIGKGALECAVCLNEFEEEDTLRLIPKCDHVFHPDCIDAWLEKHTTCPVCRAQLAPQPNESVHADGSQTATTTTTMAAADIETQNGDASTEQGVEQSGERDRQRQHEVLLETESEILEYLRAKLNRNRRSKSTRRLFNRSHSIGHLMIKPGDDLERFTLKLPVEVRKQIINRKLHRATSLVVLPRDESKTMSCRSSSKRPEWLNRLYVSDRWIAPFFTRMLSKKVVAGDGEGTSTQPVLSAVQRSGSVQPPV